MEYKCGPENKAADALSRVEHSFLAISKPRVEWWTSLQHECAQHPFYSNLIANPDAVQRDGVWFVRGKVYLNPSSELLPHIL